MGRCQPGQFKGRSLRVLRPVVAHATRTVMTATSETYDVVVVGGGISGGWMTISSVLRGLALKRPDVGRDLPHETTVAGGSFAALRPRRCAASGDAV